MKHLIITGDDFGLSHRVNEAIESQHQTGLVTQASLMVNEKAADEAVEIARRNPNLLVGLHLSLCLGKSLAATRLADSAGNFTRSPIRAGLRYAFSPWLRQDLTAEIQRQAGRFIELGFRPVYWDGHAHMHLHPVVFDLALPIVTEAGFRFTRVVREPHTRRTIGWVFHALSRRAIPRLESSRIGFADRVRGLSETGKLETPVFEGLLGNLPDGLTEIYFHPGAEQTEPDPRRLLEVIRTGPITLTNAERETAR